MTWAEMARSAGTRAELIDGPDDIAVAWFDGRETVLITAGASAPEDIVPALERVLGRNPAS